MIYINRFNPKINSYEFSSGSSSVVISSVDMQAVIASILGSGKTTPMDVAHLYAYHQFGDIEISLKEFKKMLKPFMYNRLIANETKKNQTIDTKILLKYHQNIVTALDDVTECVFNYLTRNKIKRISLLRFMPKIKKDTFARHYRHFIKGVIEELEDRRNKLEITVFYKVIEVEKY